MILYQDQLIDKEQVHIDIEDRGYQFGDGIYEVIRAYDGKFFYLEDHLERFNRSASELAIELPYSLALLKQKLLELLHDNQFVLGNVYLQLTRGVAPRSHPFPKQGQPVLVAYTQPSPRPVEQLNKGITAITSADIRWLRCDIKSLNLLGAVLAKQKAIENNVVEAILIRDGMVTEGSLTNLFIVDEETIWTHPANHLILSGVTRKLVLQLAKAKGLSIQLSPFPKDRLFTASECFVTGTTMEVCPVVQIDGQLIGDGKPGLITRLLQEEYVQLINENK